MIYILTATGYKFYHTITVLSCCGVLLFHNSPDNRYDVITDDKSIFNNSVFQLSVYINLEARDEVFLPFC